MLILANKRQSWDFIPGSQRMSPFVFWKYCFINTTVVNNFMLKFFKITQFKTHKEAKSLYIKCVFLKILCCMPICSQAVKFDYAPFYINMSPLHSKIMKAQLTQANLNPLYFWAADGDTQLDWFFKYIFFFPNISFSEEFW